MAPTRDRKAFVHQDDAAKGRPGRDGARRSACGDARRRRAPAATEGAAREDQCQSRKIFIGGLSSDTTTEDLRLHFARFGALADAVVLQWADGRSRGFGYVTFEEASAVAAVLRTRHALGGRPVDVKRAVPGTNKLFVGGLPQNATAAELREHFEAYGVVSDAVVMIDPSTSRSRGFGFVCFCPGQEGAVALESALEQYQHHSIHGKWIEVKSAASPHRLGQEQTDALALTAAACAAGAFPRPGAARPSWACPAGAEALAGQGADLAPPRPPGQTQPPSAAPHCAAAGAEVPGPPRTPPGLHGLAAWGLGGEGAGPSPWPPAVPAPLGGLLLWDRFLGGAHLHSGVAGSGKHRFPGGPDLLGGLPSPGEQRAPQAPEASVLAGFFPPPGLLVPPGVPVSCS